MQVGDRVRSFTTNAGLYKAGWEGVVLGSREPPGFPGAWVKFDACPYPVYCSFLKVIGGCNEGDD